MASILNDFTVLIRRLILLYIAMFMADASWLQVGIFMILSCASLMYLGYTQPFKSRKQNLMSIFNEITALSVAYLVMVLNGMSHDEDTF